MEYKEVIEKWGRKLLTDAGIRVSLDDTVTVILGYEEGGGCETCSYTEGTVEVHSRKGSITLRDYTFSEALNELVKVASEEAIKN